MNTSNDFISSQDIITLLKIVLVRIEKMWEVAMIARQKFDFNVPKRRRSTNLLDVFYFIIR